MNNKKVIICPLNWGLGHASRMIPLAYQMFEQGAEVWIAGGIETLALFSAELPDVPQIYFPGFKARYSRYKWLMVPVLLAQFPLLFWASVGEHFRLKKLIRQYHPDIIVSDNRFGLWSKQVITVYVTHQVIIKLPRGFKWFEDPLAFFHRYIIEKYNYCWIPDDQEASGLAGELSHPLLLPKNSRYIGYLSRFGISAINKVAYSLPAFDVVALISGPEPQRSQFEALIIKWIEKSNGTGLIALGKPDGKGANLYPIGKNIIAARHLTTEMLKTALFKAKLIVARGGYSTLMDLVALQKTALIVPTPGQPEQEYLAESLSGYSGFYFIKQENLMKVDRATIDISKTLNIPFISGELTTSVKEVFSISETKAV